MKAFSIIICIMVSSSLYADIWVTEDVDSIADEYFDNASIAMEADNTLHIAYQQHTLNSSSELKYASNSGSTWTTETVESNGSSHLLATNISLTLDASENPGIAFSDNTLNYLMKYTEWSGTAWTTEVVDSANDWCRQVSLCSNPVSNTPVIAYSFGTFNQGLCLKLACYESQWEISPVDTLENMGFELCMDLAADGTPHISYFDWAGLNLRYAYSEGDFFETFIVDNDDVVGLCNSIALDSNGNPHISYYDFTNDDLKYAHYSGTNWVIESVDSPGKVGTYCTSIAVDSNNRPHISYFHDSHDCLMHAWHNGSEWEMTTVDEGYHAGRSSSIVIDSNDIPHIAYTAMDNTTSFLRHAYLSSEGIESSGQSESVTLTVSPNPCTGTAAVNFNMPVSGHVTLSLYDVSGRIITTIADESFSEAAHTLTVSDLSPGIYICALKAGELSTSQKLVVLE